jgi:hypothetical protein
MVDGHLIAPVCIAQGMHQYDPLSPLLCNPVLEPLLAFLRTHMERLAPSLFTLRALVHTDDMLIAIRDQADFGMLETGLCLHVAAGSAKVNHHMSEMMLLNEMQIRTLFNTIRLLWTGTSHTALLSSSQIHSSSTLMPLAEWKWIVRDILIAKRYTTRKRNTLAIQFNSA